MKKNRYTERRTGDTKNVYEPIKFHVLFIAINN